MAEYCRFNLKLPVEHGGYLNEMAWRNRTTITQYLTDFKPVGKAD